MKSKEELNNGTVSGLITDSGGKDSTNFALKDHNELKSSKNTNSSNDNSSQKAKKKAKGLAKLLTTIATVVSAGMVGIVGLNVINPPRATVSAEIQEIYTTDRDVYYFITLENYNEGDDVYVVLYNDFTNRTQKAESSEFDGGFEDLQTNMYYNLEVRQGDITIASKKVRTVYERQTEKPDYEDYDPEDDPTQGNNPRPNTSDGGDEDDPTQGGGNQDPTNGNPTNNDPTGAGTNNP